MTDKQAIRLVEKNEGSEFCWKDYCFDTSYDFEELVRYIKAIEIREDNDYSCVLNDIEQRLDSCGFSHNEYLKIINALGISEHFQVLSAR